MLELRRTDNPAYIYVLEATERYSVASEMVYGNSSVCCYTIALLIVVLQLVVVIPLLAGVARD